ncbi:SIS domain-containing protein [Sporomusa acidovorans]|uniref:3-hexulose-6-phosphate isomerase n=1 Tax=Sporomusa acidovorans (strain ATCC 49682 / DSM 3132 / Mol) TaxID=1123286 RepID=A0ABZ3JA94_SPOA4|nr:SIS domain-containing protein [Sporomusa acidovorans]OZC17374.1 3-hexulose-6-phosphate isomerase [Sporomusa acidovorans DSM 3132]SDF67724.1 6-phospho-3-hexuloisomerase [Sporomusa acidovorans]
MTYRELYEVLLSEHRQVFAAQDEMQLESMMKMISNAARIFVTGCGREGIAARSFAMRLMHLGKETHWLWDDTTPGMQQGDLFIVVNGSGKIGYIDYLLDQAEKTGASRLVITGAPLERTPQEAEYTLFVPACVYKGRDRRVVQSVQPMGNLFEQHLFLLFDIVVMLLADKMNLTPEQMESRHRNIE